MHTSSAREGWQSFLPTGSWCTDTLCSSSTRRPMGWMAWTPWTQPPTPLKAVITMTQMRWDYFLTDGPEIFKKSDIFFHYSIVHLQCSVRFYCIHIHTFFFSILLHHGRVISLLMIKTWLTQRRVWARSSNLMAVRLGRPGTRQWLSKWGFFGL